MIAFRGGDHGQHIHYLGAAPMQAKSHWRCAENGEQKMAIGRPMAAHGTKSAMGSPWRNAAVKIVSVLGLASALWAQAPNAFLAPSAPCPSLAPAIHSTQGYLDGIWWQSAPAEQRRIYVEAYLDAREYAKRRSSLAMTFLTDFYTDASLRNIPVKDAIGAYLRNSQQARRK